MTLKRQLLLVSLLTLMLPWAGCQFIRETESALREGQQQMLAGTARAIADSLSRYEEEFPDTESAGHVYGDQLYGHPLDTAPLVDGYIDDWALDARSLRLLRGTDGPIRFAIGLTEQFAYLYVDVTDRAVVYADSATILPERRVGTVDRIQLVTANPPYLEHWLSFAAEAPGLIVTYLRDNLRENNTAVPEPTVRAYWQDVPGGYHLEARIPRNLLGTHIGLSVDNASTSGVEGVRSSSYAARLPGAFVRRSADLEEIAAGLLQPGTRMIITDASGWRLASVGGLADSSAQSDPPASPLLRFAYSTLVVSGTEAMFAEPDPSGREQQNYVATALEGQQDYAWFRGDADGNAIVAVAAPIRTGAQTRGAVILQQGTDAILSLTNQGLVRLMNVTLIAMLVVGAVLLGYATWLSRRIRSLSVAAEAALESDDLAQALPSARAGDEVGDLSRSFSSVLTQLGEYNEYLRTLASKLSHELRTPLAIVTSSLENLEHENLSEESRGYTERAKGGADRLRRILSAMSEASRVEELMKNAEPEAFDLAAVVRSTVTAYRDAYPHRLFEFHCDEEAAVTTGSPELFIQMLDKLVDNAVSFSADGDAIDVELERGDGMLELSVTNPGPPLPERMQNQLFDSMVSVRKGGDDKHLGLGLYVARLIAEGHDGRINAENTERGVRFCVRVPAAHSDTYRGRD